MFQILIVPATNGQAAGKIAEAEVHFTAGPLAGLKLVGFSLWDSQWPDRRTGGYVRVTMPSRDYVDMNGQAKRFDLLRPVDRDQDQAGIDALRDAILEAYNESEGQVAQAQQMARQVGRAAAGGGRQWQNEPPARPAARAPRYSPPAGARGPAPRPAAAPRSAPPVRRSAPVQAPAPRPVVDANEPPPHTDDDLDYPF